MRTIMFAVICASAALTSSAAQADEADVHFEKGVALAKAGSVAEAEVELEKAWALRQAWDIAGNLGLTEAAQGKWEEAAEHMHYALKFIGSLATDEQRKGLEERYANVRARLSLVNVNPNVEVAVTIEIGSRKQASSAPVFLAEGKHTLECAAEGYEPVKLEVTAVKGETQNLKVELKKLGGERPLPVVPPEGRPVWPGWLLGGVGLASAGVGAVLVGVSQGMLGDAEAAGQEIDAQGELCSSEGGGSDRCATLAEDLDSAGALSTTGIVMLAAGAAIMVAGVIYLVLPNEPSQATIGLMPWATPDGAGFMMRGAY